MLSSFSQMNIPKGIRWTPGELDCTEAESRDSSRDLSGSEIVTSRTSSGDQNAAKTAV